MPEFRYHRLATNLTRWQKPHAGRLGNGGQGADYVSTNGFGHEDWNFCYDIWDDNRLHLYTRKGPSSADLGKTFNVALGAVTEAGHVLVAFCESARFETSTLDRAIWLRRAHDLHLLDRLGQLGGEWQGKSVDELADMLENGDETFSLSVHPNALRILDEPVQIPSSIVKPNHYRYQLLHITESEYSSLQLLSDADANYAPTEEDVYAEGALVLRVHKSRERSKVATADAKKKFIKQNGSLFCEICRWSAEVGFGDKTFENQIIEAHHDVPISSDSHGGQTKTSDFKMLCPNCHRAIHRTKPMLTVNEFRERFF